MPTWLSRLLWMITQAAAIGAGMWLSFWSPYANKLPEPPQAYFLTFMTWTLVVAFATGLITRLWDLSLTALARRRSAGRQRQ